MRMTHKRVFSQFFLGADVVVVNAGFDAQCPMHNKTKCNESVWQIRPADSALFGKVVMQIERKHLLFFIHTPHQNGAKLILLVYFYHCFI